VTGRPLGPATIAYTELVARLTATYRANLDEVARAALAADIERNQQRVAEQGPDWLHDDPVLPMFTVDVEPSHGTGGHFWMARCPHCPTPSGYTGPVPDQNGDLLHNTEEQARETADRHEAWHQNRGW
jgi:hypothetical protein